MMFAGSSVVSAATITVSARNDFSIPVINISGEINSSDGDRFSAIAYRYPYALVNLSGPGGSLLSGIQIGTIIRLKGFPTAVMEGNTCASACAYAWLAGVQRYVERNSKIGFHAAYVVTQGAAKETGVGNALLGSYLGRIGLSDDAIVFFTSPPPEGMAWLQRPVAERLGLNIQDISKVQKNQGVSIVKPRPPPNADALDEATAQFVQRYFSYWSTDDEQAIQYLTDSFEDSVIFYGKSTPKNTILKEKIAMIRRWPARVYAERPSSIRVTCNRSTMVCEVSGILDWEVRSEARTAIAGGVAQFRFSLDFTKGRPKVIAEDGEVLERKKYQ